MNEWPDHILNPPGIVGEVVSWMRDNSGMLQPKFALAAGLTVCAALVGRAVKDRTGQMTNLYALAIGNTSAGKNAPICLIHRLVSALGQKKLLVGEATSSSAIELLLDDFPVRLFLLDEIGFYLSAIRKAGRSDANLSSVIPALMKVWSGASFALLGKVRAADSSGKYTPPRTIERPCVSLYGTATPDTMFDGVTSKDIADGDLGRYLPFISTTRPRFVARDDPMVPPELIGKIEGRLARWGVKKHGAKSQDGKKFEDRPSPGVFPADPVAEVVFRELDDFVHERMTESDRGEKINSLWGKAGELARRVALAIAVFDPDVTSITVGIADYAVELVKLAFSDLVEYVRRHVGDSKVERIKKRLLEIVRTKGTAGAERGLITRRTQDVGRRERDDALADLVDSGEVVKVERPGRGKKFITTFYAADELKKAQERFECDEADL